MNVALANMFKHVYVKYALVIIWMLVIFMLSNQPAVQSTESSDIFLHAAHSIDITFFQHVTEFIVRKSAHFTLYAVLGVLMFNLFRSYNFNTKKTILVGIFASMLYACTDEIHQLYIPGRSGQLRDVLIDTTGAAVGVGIYYAYQQIYRHRVDRFARR